MATESSIAGRQRRLCVLLRDAPAGRILEGILRQWGYALVNDPAVADLVLAEDGLPVPPGAEELRLCASGGAPGRLGLPLAVEDLWARLESRFHHPVRRHIRIPLEVRGSLQIRGESAGVCIHSLSDLGARFAWEQELIPGEPLVLHFPLGEQWSLAGRVIYMVPGRETELAAASAGQVGVVFEHPSRGARKALRMDIIRRLFETAGQGMGAEDFHRGLARLGALRFFASA